MVSWWVGVVAVLHILCCCVRWLISSLAVCLLISTRSVQGVKQMVRDEEEIRVREMESREEEE